MTKLAIIGGLGHVGLPLCLVFCEAGLHVAAIDSDPDRLHSVRNGRMPFLEIGAPLLLTRHLAERLTVYDATDAISQVALMEADAIIVTLGTPIDEYQNPRPGDFLERVMALSNYLEGKLLVLRSTVSPGTTERLAAMLKAAGVTCDVAFCPERILQGHAIRELQTLPQIVSGVTPKACQRAAELFRKLEVEIVRVSVGAAEVAKLELNGWRYVSFAFANECHRLCVALGIDYCEVERAMKTGYERAAALPSPGFAAGPCLLKDTMQLVAASPHGFPLGLAAREVNERTPDTIVAILRSLHGPLEGATVGILGMAFKADNDDTRDSLSFKLKRQLEFAGAKVLCSDEHAEQERDWVTMETLVEKADAIVLAVGHRAYHGLKIPDGKVCVDLFAVTQR